jgi:hypothetical protein
MSAPFEFLYKLNSEATQNAVLSSIAATAATEKKEYGPTSHFFVDESKLATIVSANYTADAFGPVTGSATTKYRTTSKIRAIGTDPVKVFAICDGQVLMQPCFENGVIDTTKVNLILKPSTSYNPLKIKYFIYRGIRKEDIMDVDNNLKAESNDTNQPSFLAKLWFQFKNFYTDVDNTAPTVFPASLIGYEPNVTETTLIENVFTKKETTAVYQLPLCSEGEHLGNFTGEIGLDIVLDHGDYQLQNQEELFKFDLKFARKKEHIFDTATIPSSTAVKIKRYKEYIHQFMDAAAFWGSHIECGAIKTIATDAATDVAIKKGLKTNEDVFTKIVNKYQTQNKIYLYIQGENNRSYNYYDATRKVFGFSPTGQLNQTEISGWPIIIEELAVTASTSPKYTEGVTFNLQYNIDTRIPEPERHVAVDVIAANNNTSAYPLLEKPKNPVAPATVPAFLTNKTASITTVFQVNGTKSCATFLMLYANLKQEFPLKNYYNDLFPVNLNTNFRLPTTATEDLRSCVTYDKSRMVNLDDVLDVGASIQNKVVFDNGKGPAVAGVATRKARRLYMAILKRNSTHDLEYDNLNIDTVTAIFDKSDTPRDQYARIVYNSTDFSVYRGTFTDLAYTDKVNSLTLVHENSLLKRNSFFHLGITEEEYNKLVYGQISVPVVTPPAPIPQLLPVDADNVFFYLEEVLSFVSKNVQKFKVGMRFDDNTLNVDNTGNRVTFFPSTANEVYVYTIDGFYFFSKEYAEYQEFYNEFAKAKVEFRTIMDQNAVYDHDNNNATAPIPLYSFNPPTNIPTTTPFYNGEFGFDWLRIGDNGEEPYESIITGGYERPTATDTNTEFEYDLQLTKGIEAFKALQREYKSIPTQKLNKQYFAPYLNLFSKTYSDTINTSPKPPYEADLRVLVQIDEALNKLEFDYDRTLFIIDKPILSDNAIRTTKGESIDKTIKITCLRDFSETQQIKVLAYPVGETDKKKAKLAGIIIVGRNDVSIRKEVKFVAVKVKTNINGIISIGSFSNIEIDNLKNALYQSLITGKIEQYVAKDTSGNIIVDSNGSSIDYLDLTSDNNFKIRNVAGVNTFGQFIYKKVNSNDTNIEGNLAEDYNYPNHDFHKYLKNIFLNNPLNLKYKNDNYFTIFSFGEDGYDLAQGQIESVGMHNLVLFKTRDNCTMNHEGLHGLGLQHTHRNDTPIKEVERKYIYPEYGAGHIKDTTDNVLSYLPTGITTWYWQWKIMLNKLK